MVLNVPEKLIRTLAVIYAGDTLPKKSYKGWEKVIEGYEGSSESEQSDIKN